MYYRCNVCGVKFEEYSSLEGHGKTHDEDQFPMKSDVFSLKFNEVPLSSSDNLDEQNTSFRCNVCGVKFEEYSSLEVHGRTHNEKKFLLKSDVCGLKFDDSSSTSDKLGEQIASYRCDVCGVKFQEYSSLTVHGRTHEEGKFSCERSVCSVKFDDISLSSLDKIDKQIKGSNGSNAYDFKLEEHMSIMGHKQSHSTNGISHKRTHTGERPFKCNVCDKGYKWRNNLSAHKRSHTEDMLFKCNLCVKRFTRRWNLTLHKRTHTGDARERPYMCDVCGVRFRCSYGLVQHKRIHSKERPFKCDVCGAKFKSRSGLMSHKWIHTRGLIKKNLKSYLQSIPGSPSVEETQLCAVKGSIKIIKRALGHKSG